MQSVLGEERCIQENVMERDHLKDLGVYGKEILNSIFKKYDGEMAGLI
jgi:hypothetical protein